MGFMDAITDAVRGAVDEVDRRLAEVAAVADATAVVVEDVTDAVSKAAHTLVDELEEKDLTDVKNVFDTLGGRVNHLKGVNWQEVVDEVRKHNES